MNIYIYLYVCMYVCVYKYIYIYAVLGQLSPSPSPETFCCSPSHLSARLLARFVSSRGTSGSTTATQRCLGCSTAATASGCLSRPWLHLPLLLLRAHLSHPKTPHSSCLCPCQPGFHPAGSGCSSWLLAAQSLFLGHRLVQHEIKPVPCH